MRGGISVFMFYLFLPPCYFSFSNVIKFSNQKGKVFFPLFIENVFLTKTALVFIAQVFREEKYLREAMECSDVIWQRGLLRKGYGICHGTAGNGYSFLSLYHLTQDKKYLYRACKFAEWCLDYGAHGCRIPDRPYSLFEGMAGAVHFLSDILRPETAQFPAFELGSPKRD